MDYHNHMNKSSSQNFQFIFLYLLICIVFFKSGSLEAQDFGSESQSKEILVETIKDWISKKENVESLQSSGKKLGVAEFKIIPLEQGNKVTRIVCWRFPF